MTDSMDKFTATRDLFPHTSNVAYFNSASYGPFCTPVAKAIKDNVDLRVASEVDDSHDAFTAIVELCDTYAGFIGAAPETVSLGMNTSFGLNIAAFGLPLKAADEILVSDVEFPAIPYAFRGAAEERGLKMKFVPSKNRFFDIDAFERAVTDRTRVLALSFVQFFNGYRNDLKTLSEICRKHDMYFVVDGIQGMGVEPIDVVDLNIDVFSSGCQKWMLSPQGCGFFYLADSVRDSLKRTHADWLDCDWGRNFTDLFKYNQPNYPNAWRFSMGYYAVLNLLGMRAASHVFSDLGIESIQKHNYALIDRLAAYLGERPEFSITSSMNPKHRSSIFTFTCDGYEQLHRELIENRIICVRREGSIRISVHLFNNEDDIDRLIECLDNFAKRQ
jgi:selenocysteine lyase/cysteine desulfurase